MSKRKRISAFLLSALMLTGMMTQNGLIQTAYAADEYAMKFTFIGTQYTVTAGQSGSGTGVQWSCDGSNNVTITFTDSGTFVVDEGIVTNANVTVTGGGAGGSSGSGYRVSNLVARGSGGNGGGGGATVTKSVTIGEGSSHTVTVGAGGAGGQPQNAGTVLNGFSTNWAEGKGGAGGASSFDSVTAAGGQVDAGGAGAKDVQNGYADGGNATSAGGGGGGAVASRYDEDDCGNFKPNDMYACWLCGYCSSGDPNGITYRMNLYGVPTTGRKHASQTTIGSHKGGAGLNGGGTGGVPGNEHCNSSLVGGGSAGANTGAGGGGGAYGTRVYKSGSGNGTFYATSLSGYVGGFATAGGKGGSGLVTLTAHSEAAKGKVTLTKTSSDNVCTVGNSCYSLEGAKYGIYKTRNDAAANTNSVASLTTDANGVSNTVEIPIGTYYVKEITAPKGYELDTDVYEVIVENKKTTSVNVTDVPILDPIDILLKKTDAATGSGTSSGIATLAGAEFTFTFYPGQYSTVAAAEATTPARQWVFKTNANGFVSLLYADTLFVSGDAPYRSETGDPTMPLGTVVIQETKAPEHYFIDSTKFLVNITESGASQGLVTPYNAPEHPNTLVHGGVSVDKQDSFYKATGKTQGDATLAGAQFTIYNENNVPVTVNGAAHKKGEAVATIVTDKNGHAESAKDLLPLGSYSIRETKAPTGYTLNETWKETFTITDAENGKIVSVGSMTDDVVTGSLTVRKEDKETGLLAPQGDGSFAGAVFNVVNASDAPILFGSMEYAVGSIVTTITANSDGVAAVSGLPYGRYTVTEVSIPAATGYVVNMDYDSTVAVSGSSTYSAADCPEEVGVYGGVQIQKIDAMLRAASPEGNATLTAATYEITNTSAQPVVINGKTYAVGDIVATVRTNAKGQASLDAILPIGTYTVKEVSPSKGYQLNSDWSQTFTIRTNGKIVELTGDKVCPETPVSGGVSVQKLDKDTGTNIGIGGIRMEDAEFSIINRSANPVVYNGNTVQPLSRDFDRNAPKDVVMTITTNVDGFATSGAHDLPYGTYEIYETKAPTGYLLNTEWVKEFSVIEDGKIIAFDINDACVEELARTDVHFQKVNGVTGDPLPNIVFRVTHLETGESHIIVTDPNGVYDSSYIAHSTNTNGNDAAVDAAGNVDESKLDYRCGTWFGGGTPLDARPDGGRMGAFIYGTYRFEELRTSANEKLTLVDMEKVIYAKDALMDLGTIEDHIPEELETVLTDGDSGEHIVTRGKTVVLYDTVYIHNAVPGREYTVEAVLMEKDTGKPLCDAKGNPITASYRFKAEGTEKTLEKKICFKFNGSLLTGSDLVAFEKLTNGKDKVYAIHEDLDDESQTVRIPQIRTVAEDTDGSKFLLAGSESVIVDTVYYSNFLPEKTVTLNAKIVDKSTGQFVKDKNGKDIEVSYSFKPEQSDGNVKVKIKFDSSELKGHQLVVYEYAYLTASETLIASHEDINDEAQTVTILKINTVAAAEENGDSKALAAAESTKIYDRVDYEGLIPGNTYTLHGELADAETGDPVSVNGVPVTADNTFVAADTGSGNVMVVFELDSSDLAGKAVVVFESLCEGSSGDGKVLAQDKTIPNEPETVYIPQIFTTATSENGSHTLPLEETMIVKDQVKYSNLYTDEEYLIEGKLMDKATGKPLLDAAGNEITASQTFTPKKSEGGVTIVFRFDAAPDMAGKTAVAFETLSEKDISGEYRFLTDHRDIEDEDQTVHVLKILTTAATVSGTQVVKAEGKVTIIDTVHVFNAVPGSEYTFRGSIVDDSGEKVKKAETETKTVAPASEFDVELTFTVDTDTFAAAGHSVTVFEKMFEEQGGRDGKPGKEVEVASHEEPKDEDQTIWFPEIATVATGKDGEKLIILENLEDEATIIDTVVYKALQPGKEYLLTGTLVQKLTGEPLTDDNGNPITAEMTFIPEQEDGSVELTFTVPARYVAGQKAVAFERITLDGVLVAMHEDINDADQTVEFTSIAGIYKYNGTTMEPVSGAVITVTDTTADESYDVTTGTDGYARFTVYGGHSYSYREKTAPEGYTLNPDSFEFHVDEKGKTDREAKLIDLLTGTVVLSKTNSQSGGPVPGAVIAVYRKSGDTYTEMFRQTTDEFGRIYFYPGDMLGTFYYKEIAAPEGYYLDDDLHSFTIKPDLTVTGQTSFTNAPIGTVVLKKSSERGDHLQGAQYSVYDQGGKLLLVDSTDEFGRVYFMSPGPGQYFFIETEAPKGYALNNTKQYFSIDENGLVSGITKLVDKADSNPTTGDSLNKGAWIGGCAFSAMISAGSAVVLYRRRKKVTPEHC